MSERIESIQRSFALLPIDDNSRDHNGEKKNFENSRKRNVQKKSSVKEYIRTEQEEVAVHDNMKLSFAINRNTGETGAILFDSNSNTSRMANFGEVTKASEKVFDRTGIVFDKRG